MKYKKLRDKINEMSEYDIDEDLIRVFRTEVVTGANAHLADSIHKGYVARLDAGDLKYAKIYKIVMNKLIAYKKVNKRPPSSDYIRKAAQEVIDRSDRGEI